MEPGAGDRLVRHAYAHTHRQCAASHWDAYLQPYAVAYANANGYLERAASPWDAVANGDSVGHSHPGTQLHAECHLNAIVNADADGHPNSTAHTRQLRPHGASAHLDVSLHLSPAGRRRHLSA